MVDMCHSKFLNSLCEGNHHRIFLVLAAAVAIFSAQNCDAFP